PRALGLPRDPVDAAARIGEAVEAGRTSSIGLGRVNGRLFCFSAGIGLDAEAVRRVEQRGRDGDGRRASNAYFAVTVVGVFVDPEPGELELVAAALPQMVPQFSGRESPDLCAHLRVPYLKVFHVQADDPQPEKGLAARLPLYPGALPILETASPLGGGSGRTFAWARVRSLVQGHAVVISGGLDPDNVGACVRQVRPYAVDVRSGVGSGPALDPAKVQAFIDEVRQADAAP
ncbi:MAG TPA: hypothetical protein VI138_05745, partial [Candidatus Dormibacteraeota bacterium]